MDFKKINVLLPDKKPLTFLTTVLNQPIEIDPFFIFSPTIENQFEQNIQYLLSEETITVEDLQKWQKKSFLTVAQTIDGDYIAGTDNQTFVIPVSLYKSDIEQYNLTLGDFFCAYTVGDIHSNLLPKI